MASPGYVVRVEGSPESLHGASHGGSLALQPPLSPSALAGRVTSRTKAMQSFIWSATKKLPFDKLRALSLSKRLAERGVELLSAGLDEVPVSIRTSTPSRPLRPTWSKSPSAGSGP